MNPVPSREIYWNIPEHLWLYVLLVPFLVLFVYGCYRRWGALRLGKRGLRFGQVRQRLKAVADQALLQRRIVQEKFSGLMHLGLSWRFLILFVATTLVAFQDYFGLPVLEGPFYLYFMSLTVDLFGIAALLGTLMGGAGDRGDERPLGALFARRVGHGAPIPGRRRRVRDRLSSRPLVGARGTVVRLRRRHSLYRRAASPRRPGAHLFLHP